MADKKKMSVAEMLAAARQSDGGAKTDAPSDPRPAAPTEDEPVSAAKPAQPAKGGGRPSVAEMMAMARGEKQAAPQSAAPAKPKASPPAAPKAPAKPVAAAPSGPKDTGSILAAARAQSKPGPMSKAEAASKSAAAGKPSKPKVVLPPRPTKPAYAQSSSTAAAQVPPDGGRRLLVVSFSMLVGSFLALGFSSLAVTMGMWTLGLARFMFPNILREPPSRFKVGFPTDFPPGMVETKYKAQFGVWIVNGEYDGKPQIYALQSICTHLGCTPNWLEAEQKFKCPCHGSGFYKDGINFEGPAPRPLERYAIRIADDGQIEVDKSHTFQQEMGEWQDSASFVVA